MSPPISRTPPAELDVTYLGAANVEGRAHIIQSRGSPPGFLGALDETPLGFADLSGNLQSSTLGNCIQS